MYCSNCGKQIDDNSKFCNGCGSAQTPVQTPQPTAPPSKAQAPQPTAPPPKAQAPQPTAPPPVAQAPQPTAPPPVAQAPQPTAPPPVAQAPQPTAPQPQYYNPAPVTATPKKKGKTGVIIASVVAGLLVFALTSTIVSSCVAKSLKNNYIDETDAMFEFETISDDAVQIATDSDYYSDDADDTVASASDIDSYEDIFSFYSIVDTDTFFVADEVRRFASVDEDGMIDKLEFAADDDVVVELCETIWLDISDYSDEEREDLDKQMKDNFKSAVDLGCSVTYLTLFDYYKVTVHSYDLDDNDHLTALSDAGIVEIDSFLYDYISLDASAQGLLDAGYYEK